MGMEDVKLKVLQEKYDAVKMENDEIFEREMKGEHVKHSEWLDAKQRLEAAEKELNAQKQKVQELNGEIMTDDEIEELFGNNYDVDEQDDVIDSMVDNWSF